MKVKMRHGALKEIRNSPGVISDLESRAARIASAAGEGMETRPAETGNRARVAVVTSTWEAMHAEATTSALTSALDAGR